MGNGDGTTVVMNGWFARIILSTIPLLLVATVTLASWVIELRSTRPEISRRLDQIDSKLDFIQAHIMQGYRSRDRDREE